MLEKKNTRQDRRLGKNASPHTALPRWLAFPSRCPPQSTHQGTRKEIQVLIGSLLVLGSTFIFNISTAAGIALPILVLLGTFSFIHRKFRRISYVLTYAAILFIFTKFLLKV